MSVLGLVGVVVQPHVMTATGSGKTETEARVGMVYGNFIKRLLTIAWAFTGLIALAAFPEVLAGLDPTGQQARQASETLFGRAIQQFLGDGWRGLMIACLIAGVTSAETFMVVGSALFTRNFYVHAVPGRSDAHYLWVGRLASGGLLALGILLAVRAESVTQLVVVSVKVIGLLGAAFWLGVVWRRANAAGVWASFLGSLLAWALMSADTSITAIAAVGPAARSSSTPRSALAPRVERAASGHHHARGRIRAADPREPAHSGPETCRSSTRSTPGFTRPSARKRRFAGRNRRATCPNRPRWAWRGRGSITASRPGSPTRGFKPSASRSHV